MGYVTLDKEKWQQLGHLKTQSLLQSIMSTLDSFKYDSKKAEFLL